MTLLDGTPECREPYSVRYGGGFLYWEDMQQRILIISNVIHHYTLTLYSIAWLYCGQAVFGCEDVVERELDGYHWMGHQHVQHHSDLMAQGGFPVSIVMEVGRFYLRTNLTNHVRNSQRIFSYASSAIRNVTSKGFLSVHLQNKGS